MIIRAMEMIVPFDIMCIFMIACSSDDEEITMTKYCNGSSSRNSSTVAILQQREQLRIEYIVASLRVRRMVTLCSCPLQGTATVVRSATLARGNYWSRTLSSGSPSGAKCLRFNSRFIDTDSCFLRCSGRGVRPVRLKE